MLSHSQIHQYHEDGFVIPDFRMPAHVLVSIRERHVRLLERHPEFRDYCPALLHFDLGFAEYCEVPGILDMVMQLIGPDIALWNMSFFAKPPFNGRATPWHQDGQYWPIRPLATCSVWVAVDDSARDNGCVRVIGGSHRERRLLHHQATASPDLLWTRSLHAVSSTRARRSTWCWRRARSLCTMAFSPTARSRIGPAGRAAA